MTHQLELETRDGDMSKHSEVLNLSDLPDEFALFEDEQVVIREKHPTKKAHKAKCKLGGFEAAKNRVTKIYEKIGENSFQIIYQDSGGSHVGHKALKGDGPGSTII